VRQQTADDGKADAQVRQLPDLRQGVYRTFLHFARADLQDFDPGIHGSAAQRGGQGEMGIRQRGPGLRAGSIFQLTQTPTKAASGMLR
jgi:hypothetical protein